MTARSQEQSAYMQFAKLRSSAKFNLATSGVLNYSLAGLPVTLDQLEINGATIYGYAPLNERLAKKSGVAPECVVASQGTSMSNHLAMAALFDPGDEVLIEEPTYELILGAARFLGANIVRFPRRFENGFQVDPDDIADRITPRTKLIVLCNLHNPSSVLILDDVLSRIGEIAARNGARVLVDEVYLETLWDRQWKSSFHLGENFVVTTSLTKAYGLSGLRCGWILAEPKLARRMWYLNDLFAATPAHPAELLSVIAIDNLDRPTAKAKSVLDQNRAVLNKFLDSRDDLEVVNPGIGTTVFPRLKHHTVEELDALLRSKYETSIVPGKYFEMPDHFRIGLGGDPAMTATGLERVGAALDELKRCHHR